MHHHQKRDSKQYIFFVDMSGQPYNDDLFVGMIFINKRYVQKFIQQFYIRFPSLRAFKKKSHTLSPDQLREVIKFMGERGVKMICAKFHKHKMAKYEKEILERKNRFKRFKVDLKHFKEKIVGAVYFELVKVHARKHWHYELEMCVESHLDALQVLRSLSQLCYRDNYPIHPRTNYRRIQHMLKFADFVAGAGNKLEDFVMKSFPNMVYLAPEISQYNSDKLFGINDDIYEHNAQKDRMGQNVQQTFINKDTQTLLSDVVMGNDDQKASEKTDA